MNNLSPIILFTYNRPEHTKKVLDALAQNIESRDSVLYVFCDGVKLGATSEDLLKIEAVRSLINKETRFKNVIVKVQDENKGLANSIIDGVTEVVNIHGKVIVLEDDIVTSNGFLKFMNEALEIYKNEKNVYGVTGYCFPSSKKIKESTFFLPIISSWGYGTWKDRWQNINFNGQELLELVIKNKIERKLDFGSIRYLQMLKDQVEGKNDSWAVRFYVSMILKKGIFLFPNMSLVKNIGFDGTGVHCGQDIEKQGEFFDFSKNILQIKRKVVLKSKIIKVMKNVPNRANRNFRNKCKRFIKKNLAPELIQYLNRKLNRNVKRKQDGINLFEFPRYTKTTVKLLNKEIIIPDAVSFHFMHNEIFTEEIYKFETLNNEPYIIDAGANIGLATIYLKLLYPSSKIVAFEPDSNIFEMLKSNIESFNFGDVELVRKGLWDDNVNLPFISEGADAGLIAYVDKTAVPSETIEVVSLKPYLERKVDFLKIDIEGSETVVLKDITDFLINIERIFIEYHSFVGQAQSLNEIINILTAANYRLYISTPGLSNKSPFVTIHTYNNMDMQLNIYGIKKESN